MQQHLSQVTLKSGEVVEAIAISGPDRLWHERITTLLAHKEEVWRWQVAQLLSDDVESGVETRFYLLHRDGKPFSNIMMVESGGVGLFGHVWTQPEDRLQGAASALMSQAMSDFRGRCGQALYLGTGYDSAPYHLYRKFGFEPLEANDGTMSFSTKPLDQFEAEYFSPGETEIVPFSWPQWAVASALFTGDFPGVIRNVPSKLLGRSLTEWPLMHVVRQTAERAVGESPRALALQKKSNGAVVGLASWDFDPSWPATCRVDVWCHPFFWHRAAELLASLKLPETTRTIAYSDEDCEQKATILAEEGFHTLARLPQWVEAVGNSRWADVTLWEKAK